MSRLSADANVAPNDIETAKRQLDTLFFGDQSQNIRPAGGEAIIRIAEARSERWRLENAAHAKAVAFEQEIATKNVAPRVYKAKRYLSAVANSVAKIRKYVNATQHQGSSDTFHLDIKDPMGAPLDTALEGEE